MTIFRARKRRKSELRSRKRPQKTGSFRRREPETPSERYNTSRWILGFRP
jgi:hypothetical protein